MRRRALWTATVIVLAVIAAIAAALLPRRAARADAAASRGERLRHALFALVQPVTLTNCTLERFGEPHDGGYLMCANLLDGIQAAYSYGISGYDQWGCDVSRRFSVRVHQYDCFDTRQPACPGGAMEFHAECVGSTMVDEGGRPFDTIANQFRKNGDEGKSLVVKIDVEGAEWDSFILAPDWVFERIDQLVVEFHGVESDRFVAAVQRLTRFFHVAHVHFNNFSCDAGVKPFPASVFEVLFVSRRLGKVDEGARARGPHPSDAPNNPAAPDCQTTND